MLSAIARVSALLAMGGLLALGGQAPRAASAAKPPRTEVLLRQARDQQDVATLSALAARIPGNQASDHYLRALAASYESEVQLEKGNKPEAAQAARHGIDRAREAVKLQPKNAEHHRILGTLCGQMIPANLLSALEFGRCAKEEIDVAISLDSRSASAWLARGVGNYYLPEAFGGGAAKALTDLRKAVELEPALADAWLWLGIVLRKQGDHPGALRALRKAQSLAPSRTWIQQQIAKTPGATTGP